MAASLDLSSSAPSRPELTRARRVVVKVGTRVLTHDDGRLALSNVYSVVEELSHGHRDEREMILVSSGAVGLGAESLSLDAAIPKTLADRQMCAAIGQSRLMSLYQGGLSQLGIVAGQVLLTPLDFEHREHHANLSRTLDAMLSRGVVPIVNANDVVGTEELDVAEGPERAFVENDRLAALVASHVEADLLVLLTNVDGVFDKNPHHHDDARLVTKLDQEDEQIEVTGQSSAGGLGGMRSKVEAAEVARRRGTHVVIANGRRAHVLSDILAGREVGTWLPGRRESR